MKKYKITEAQYKLLNENNDVNGIFGDIKKTIPLTIMFNEGTGNLIIKGANGNQTVMLPREFHSPLYDLLFSMIIQ